MQRIFEPITLNKLELKNRILMSSMHLNVEGAQQYDRMAHFYRLRAQNGVGLIVTAGCSPNLRGRGTLDSFSLDSDHMIEDHVRITGVVHAAGGKIALQLLHFGREALHGKLVAPSSLRLASNLFTPSALTVDEIEQTIEDFGTAAARAVRAGYDAIELVLSQGFLIHQFLASATNQRTDSWGGDFAGRSRFALAVAARVRCAVGPGFPLVFRIPCLDLLEDGLSFDETKELVRLLEPCGIDLLNVSIGWHESKTPTIAMQVPHAAFAQVAWQIKQSFPALKVAVSNRINDLRVAEQVLLDGVADMAAMGRPFLADAGIIPKSQRGEFDLVNTCIACNQSCLDHVFLNREVSCAVNPEAVSLQEGSYPRLDHRVAVAVVGGGLAGLSAAYYLAKRGAKVVLFEQSRRLGGQVNMAGKIPGKSELLETVRFFENAIESLDVELQLGRRFEAADLDGRDWAHIMVATGSIPAKQRFPGIQAGKVHYYNAVLEKDVPVEFPVAIVGAGGVACDTAKYLLQRCDPIRNSLDYLGKHLEAGKLSDVVQGAALGRDIVLLQRSGKKIAYRLGRTTRWIILQHLERLGVQFMRGATLSEVSDEGIVVRKGQQEDVRLAVKTVIIAAGQEPNLDAVNFIMNASVPYSVIGAATRTAGQNASIANSIRMGYEAAMALQPY